MSSLETLPPDQRAVLTLVLQRGRSYDDIANLLSIERAAVRDRALAALDALGPTTRVPAPQRALITDYLLGQLPERVRQQVHESLASSASERAWARVLAGELAPIAGKPLPEIPASQPAAEPTASRETAAAAAPATAPEAAAPEATAPEATAPEAAAPETAATEGSRAAASAALGRPAPAPAPAQRPSSRRGGSVVLVLVALIVIAVVIIVAALSTGGSSSKKTTTKATTAPAVTTTTGTTTTGTTTTSTTAHLDAQINLRPPSGSSKAAGIAEVVTQGKLTALVVAADHISPNTKHNAYAVWLYNPGGAAKLLGYVSPGVGKSGVLKTTGELPSNAASYKQILVTLETTTNTKTPGPTVLEGILSLHNS
jgi:hypothetical protein